MADDLSDAPSGSSAESATPPPEALPPPREPRSGVYLGRFRLAYAALAIVLGAAVGTFILLVSGPGSGPDTAWSTWKPTAEGTERARQIADYVSRRYRLPSGAQLVGVIAGPPSVQNVPISVFAIRRGDRDEDVSVLPAQASVMYILCGLGQRCAIEEGTPSRERHRLLRREALELALYTFVYMEDVESIVTFLPPRRGSDPDSALFFHRDDLRAELERPLRATLPERASLVPNGLDRIEEFKVDKLTDGHLFRFQFQQGPDGAAILVLEPATA